MHYEIISDLDKLTEFIAWLPELKDNEKYYCCLFARKKYSKRGELRYDVSQMNRFLSTKERLLEKIQQLETPEGSYKIKKKAVPQESLAFYINPNPRDLEKATYESIIGLTQMLRSNDGHFNPHAEVMSCIQRSHSKKVFLDFDVDTKDFDFKRLEHIINPACLDIVETRGGYHILVRVADVAPKYKKTFYNDIISLGVDQTGDQLLPVPGCIQGGFTPRFVEVFNN
ncbi:MAG: hypothetical protein AAFX87_24465 [Bacteroidota bacterium]